MLFINGCNGASAKDFLIILENVESWLSDESITSHTLVVCTANLYGACSEYRSPSVVYPIKADTC